jgi:prevent-host-death family protein
MADDTAVSSREAARGFSDLAGRVRFGGQRVVVTHHGKPVVAVVPIEDLRLLQDLDTEVAEAKSPKSAPVGERSGEPSIKKESQQ